MLLWLPFHRWGNWEAEILSPLGRSHGWRAGELQDLLMPALCYRERQSSEAAQSSSVKNGARRTSLRCSAIHPPPPKGMQHISDMGTWFWSLHQSCLWRVISWSSDTLESAWNFDLVKSALRWAKEVHELGSTVSGVLTTSFLMEKEMVTSSRGLLGEAILYCSWSHQLLESDCLRLTLDHTLAGSCVTLKKLIDLSQPPFPWQVSDSHWF